MKNRMSVLGLICYSSLWSGVAPDFVQVPSSFSSQPIATNTSRYFFKRIRLNHPGGEGHIFSLQNIGSRVARISAIGGETHSTISSPFFELHCYKTSNVTGTNYTLINNSTCQISTQGNFISGSDEVYALQAIGDVGRVRGFEYIPKELYSVVVAPSETLTVTLEVDEPATYEVIVMWEEIVN